MRVLTLAMAAALTFVSSARAEPLDLKCAAADAKWVLHLDVDALRQSPLVEKAYQKCLELHPEAAKHLDKVRDLLGMDPRKDLHALMVYGKDTDKHHGVLLVHADVNQKLLLAKAEKAPGHKATKFGSYELHSWTHTDRHGSHPVTGVFYKPNVLVFAESVEAVKGALDVLDGKSPGISGKESPLAGHTHPGAIFIARAAAIDPHTRCPILKQADSVRITIGEHDGQLYYRGRLEMKSAETAGQVKAIADGFQALVALKFGSDADVMKLASGLKVTAKDKTLHVQWSAPTDAVWTVVEKAAKHWAEHHGKEHGCPMQGKGDKKPSCPAKDAKPKASS